METVGQFTGDEQLREPGAGPVKQTVDAACSPPVRNGPQVRMAAAFDDRDHLDSGPDSQRLGVSGELRNRDARDGGDQFARPVDIVRTRVDDAQRSPSLKAFGMNPQIIVLDFGSGRARHHSIGAGPFAFDETKGFDTHRHRLAGPVAADHTVGPERDLHGDERMCRGHPGGIASQSRPEGLWDKQGVSMISVCQIMQPARACSRCGLSAQAMTRAMPARMIVPVTVASAVSWAAGPSAT